MSEFDDKLSAILGDQNAMSQIMALAQSLSTPGEEGAENEGGACPDGSAPAEVSDQDIRLLTALRPYLKDSRRKKLDRALELLQLLRLFKGGMG